jgi:bifunctional DNA-binding transcriptional regulator/antitoxin component of YhaV-PrlF toxin-antitoxin module
MPKVAKTLRLTSVLTKSGNEFGWHFLRFTEKAVAVLKFEDKKSRRVVCTLNGSHTFQCALLPWTKGGFCIVVNKKIRDKLGLVDGSKVKVELVKDESKYGLPMPKELREVLKQDREGYKLFHALTAGKQRTMLYYISKSKDVDRRIHMSLILVEHLKANEGKIVFPKLSEELKRPQFEI